MTASYIQDSELNELLTQSGVVVVDYTASWCGPCRLIGPYIDKLAEEYADRAQVRKIDLDQNKENAKKFNIRSIPAVLFFKNGELVEHLVGKASYETFSETLEKHL
jgi:thioredoxin 1